MGVDDQPVRLVVTSEVAGRPDPAASAQLASSLRRAGVEVSEGLPGSAVPGARGDPVTVGTILLAMAPGMVPAALAMIATIRGQRTERTVTLTDGDLSFTVPADATPEQLKAWAAMLRELRSSPSES